jgi:hypothetical protein
MLVLLAAVLFPVCGWSQPAGDDLLASSRPVAGRLLQELGAALRAALAESGPEGAIAVCRDIAPRLAGELSRETGWRIARVSLRTRNPLLGSPDAWEQRALAEFDRRVAAGERPDSLEFAEVVEEPAGAYFRYVKAIPVAPLCLACHGPRDQLGAGIRDQLARTYPHDQAVGYVPGQVRGAVTIKRRLP